MAATKPVKKTPIPPPPEPKKYVESQSNRRSPLMAISAPKWAHAKLAKLAEAWGESKSGFIVRLIAEAKMPPPKKP